MNSSTANQPTIVGIVAKERYLYNICKRALDIVVSGGSLLCLGPLWLIIAILIKSGSKGPVLFVQPAVGLDGRLFRLLKFRSMAVGAQDSLHRDDLLRNIQQKAPTTYDSHGNPIFKTALADSRRITRIGRLLRHSSLDELPQLWNVFVGDMSLVGPRPSLPQEVQTYSHRQRQRLSVRPGLTGLYQVTARNRVPVEEMIQIDLKYIEERSTWLDLKLLLRTPAVMFQGL